ncbi:unnamed protein product [Sympodiomycopsis kandeliae]
MSRGREWRRRPTWKFLFTRQAREDSNSTPQEAPYREGRRSRMSQTAQPRQFLLSLLEDPAHSTIIKQGAEAKVYKCVLSNVAPTLTTLSSDTGSAATTSKPLPLPKPILLKYRFPKHYRHPHLSQSITIQRTVSEVRALVRCARRGVNVPGVNLVDEKSGIIGLEWIEGQSVRELLGGGVEDDQVAEDSAQTASEASEQAQLNDTEQEKLMSLIGYQLAKMHSADVIHGDLTTSNMMMRNARPRETQRLTQQRSTQSMNDQLVHSLDSMHLHDGTEKELLLIDFGLSQTSPSSEDKAVDLYVLERAFNSTHPYSGHLFEKVITSYSENVNLLFKQGLWRLNIGGTGSHSGVRTGKKNNRQQQQQRESTASPWVEIERKLKDVRLRGRKRSMVG